jgi:hypothetical protein
MSDLTKIEELLEEETGGQLKGYLIIAAYQDEDDDNMLYLAEADDQGFHTSMGLVEFARTYLTRKFNETFDI